MYLNLNLGDDLFLHILLMRYKRVTFFIQYDERYEQFVNKYDNLIFIEKSVAYKFLEKFQALYNKYVIRGFNPILLNPDNYDSILFLGGSIFSAGGLKEYAKPIFNTYNYLCEIFTDRKKRCFFLGCNFEKNYPENLIKSYSRLFSRDLVDVCFRDLYSQKVFVQTPNIRFADDIVFGYKYGKKLYPQKILGISIIELKNRKTLLQHYNGYMEFLAGVIKKAVEDKYHIRLFSFCKSEGDCEAANELIKICSCTCIDTITYGGDIEEFLRIYLESSIVIGTRFHAVVLAINHGIPCLPVVYSSKTANLLDDINWKGLRFDMRTSDAMKNVLDWDKIRGMEPYKGSVGKSWENHFVKFDEWVGDMQ